MGQADIGGKRILGRAPETWVRWLLKDPSLEVKATLPFLFPFLSRSAVVLWLHPEAHVLPSAYPLLSAAPDRQDGKQVIVRWDMAVLRESPWYQGILQEGWQKGWQKGQQAGRQEEARQGILRLLRVRFDPGTAIVQDLAGQLQAVTELPVLQDLLVTAAQVESLDAFQSNLKSQTRQPATSIRY